MAPALILLAIDIAFLRSDDHTEPESPRLESFAKFYCFINCVNPHDTSTEPKCFLLHDKHVMVNICQYNRFEEISPSVSLGKLCLCEYNCALFKGISDMCPELS